MIVDDDAIRYIPGGCRRRLIQGGHKLGKLTEFEKLSKSQGKLSEI